MAGLLYSIYITLAFYFKIMLETQANFLNFLRIYKRRRAKLPEGLQNKTVVVTGANSGIGKVTTETFARLGARVIMACRDMDKGKACLAEIQSRLEEEQIPAQLELEELNLSSLESVRQCATRISSKVKQIDYLINNAGIMMCPEWKSVEGFELQFATNHLGHFLLTNMLMSRLKAAPEARIVNLSSIAHMRGALHADNINLSGIYTSLRSYTQSKLANVLFTIELARRLRGTTVSTFAVHPGLVDTELARHLNSFSRCLLSFLHRMILISPELGAQTTLYCAFEKDLEKESGSYFANCQKVESMLPHAVDQEDAGKLWEISLRMCGLGDHNPQKL